MKKSRPLYLLLFFFLLFQAYHFAFAKAQAASKGQSCAEIIRLNKLQQIDKEQQKEFVFDYTLFSETDDDDNNLSERKKIFTSRFRESSADISLMAALSEISFSPQFTNHSVYFPHYKYIFQRTLRV